MVDTPRGTVTVLFTDIVSSTELMQRLGDDRYHELRRSHMDLLQSALPRFHGHEVKSEGDAIMAVFDSAVDATACAIAMQQRIHRHNEQHPEAERLHLRVGLAAGEPIRDPDGDYHGTCVVVASRLANDAGTNQILATQLVQDLVGSRGAFIFSPLEERNLKGITGPAQVCEVGWEPGVDNEQAPVATDEVVPLPPALAAGQRVGFVGRARELLQLRDCWDETLGGQRRLVMVTGEPGIGKTRLASRFAARAHDDGGTVLYGACAEEGLLPYQPFVEALRHYVASASTATLRAHVGANGPVLARLIPELTRKLPDILDRTQPAGTLASPVRDDPESERYWFFEAILALLDAISAQRPLVLILDDLHWADAPTLQLLKHLMRAPTEASVFIIGTYREGEKHQSEALTGALADLRRGRAFEELPLGGLAGPDTAAMIEEWAGQQVPVEVSALIAERTEGNPFFIEEVLAHLWEASAIGGREEQWASRLATSIEEYGIPAGILDVINWRLARLSTACNSLLTLAAVMGREFEYAVVEHASDRSSDELLDSLDEGLAANLVREVPGRPGWYTFTHALIRDALYGGLAVARRIRKHRQVAEALEELVGDRDEYLSELAYHFSEAALEHGDAAKAIAYAKRAGSRATSLFAYEEAAQHFERALRAQALQPEPDQHERFEILIELGEAARMAGNPQLRNTATDDALALARAVGSPTMFADAVIRLRQGYTELSVAGPDETYVALLQEALEGLDDDNEISRARLLGFLAGEYYNSADQERRLTISREAVESARRSNDPETLGFTLGVRHYCLRGPQYAEERRAISAEILELARSGTAKRHALMGYMKHLEDMLQAGNLEAVDMALAARARLTAERRRHGELLLSRQLAAMRAMLDGRFAEAEQIANEALQLGRQIQSRTSLAIYSLQAFLIRKELGRLGEIAEAQRSLADRFAGVHTYRSSLALLEYELGNEAQARIEFNQLAREQFSPIPRDTNWVISIVNLTEVCAGLQDVDRAQELLELLLPYRGSNIVVAYSTLSLGPASRYLGLLSRTLCRWEEAAAFFAEAAEMCKRMPSPPWLAHTYADEAAMLLASGASRHRDRTGELLDEALSMGESLGMTKLCEQVQSLRALV